MTITFWKEYPREMVALAAYVAELTKQGVRFIMRSNEYTVEVELTGGY